MKRTILNPCEDTVEYIKERIRSNGGHCLSKHKNGKETKCKCKEFKETGICECGLYVQIDEELYEK